MSEVINSFPDTKLQFVIQKFIMPKGLRVSKCRVILNEYKKVIIFSNKNRYDSKVDVNKSLPGRVSKINPNVVRTVIMHNDIKKVIKSEVDLKDIDISKLGDGKLIFNKLFNHSAEVSGQQHRSSDCTLSSRYLTSEFPERTSFYEGKNQSYSEIIQMTEYLWSKIDYYYLDSCKLIELACDFMQDKMGSWHFIKVKHGKTELKDAQKTNQAYFKSRKSHYKLKKLD